MKVANLFPWEVEWAKGNLKHKVCWLMDVYNVPPERVINIDESAVCVIPMKARGWAPNGYADVAFVEDSRRQVTVNFAVPMGPGPMLAQIIWKGKRKAIPRRDRRPELLYNRFTSNDRTSIPARVLKD